MYENIFSSSVPSVKNTTKKSTTEMSTYIPQSTSQCEIYDELGTISWTAQMKCLHVHTHNLVYSWKPHTYSLVVVNFFFKFLKFFNVQAGILWNDQREITLTFDNNIKCQKYLQRLNTDDIK